MYYTNFNDEYFGLDIIDYILFIIYDPNFIGIYANYLPKDFTGDYYYFGGYHYSVDFCPVIIATKKNIIILTL